MKSSLVFHFFQMMHAMMVLFGLGFGLRSWGPRWDEWLNFDTYRLAEHQSMSAKKDEPTPNALVRISLFFI